MKLLTTIRWKQNKTNANGDSFISFFPGSSKRWSRSSGRPNNQCTTTPYNKFDCSAYYSHNNYYDNYTRASTHNDVNCGTDNYCCAYYNINTNNNNNN